MRHLDKHLVRVVALEGRRAAAAMAVTVGDGGTRGLKIHLERAGPR